MRDSRHSTLPSHRGLRRAGLDRASRVRRLNRRSVMADFSSGPAGIGGARRRTGGRPSRIPGRSRLGAGPRTGRARRGPVARPIRTPRLPSGRELDIRRRNGARGRELFREKPVNTSRSARRDCRLTPHDPPPRFAGGPARIRRPMTARRRSHTAATSSEGPGRDLTSHGSWDLVDPATGEMPDAIDISSAQDGRGTRPLRPLAPIGAARVFSSVAVSCGPSSIAEALEKSSGVSRALRTAPPGITRRPESSIITDTGIGESWRRSSRSPA
jgi:hypothetical protein